MRLLHLTGALLRVPCEADYRRRHRACLRPACSRSYCMSSQVTARPWPSKMVPSVTLASAPFRNCQAAKAGSRQPQVVAPHALPTRAFYRPSPQGRDQRERRWHPGLRTYLTRRVSAPSSIRPYRTYPRTRQSCIGPNWAGKRLPWLQAWPAVSLEICPFWPIRHLTSDAACPRVTVRHP